MDEIDSDWPPHNIFRDNKVHVLSEKCATCIFRPHTRPVEGSVVAEMVRNTKDNPGATVVCHHTLGTEPQKNAICRGWYDRFASIDPVLRMANNMDVIEEQELDPEH